MEEQIQPDEEKTDSDAILSRFAIETLNKTVPWIKFLSIMGFILCGFMVIFALVLLLSGGIYGKTYGAGMGSSVFLVYLVLAIVIYFPNSYLYHYAGNLRKFFNSKDASTLETAFKLQKQYWMFMGVLVIIYLSFFAIAMIFVLTSFLWQ